MEHVKQSTAITIKLGPFVDSTDGITVEDALTIAQANVRLSKNGGTFAQKNTSGSATHDEYGYYDISLDTTDTGTLGRLRVAVSVSGALPVFADYMVMPANAWDALYGSDLLQVDLTQISGAAVSTSTAQLGVNAVQIGAAVPASATIGTVTNLTNANPSAAAIADAVWDELRAGHTTANTFGAGVIAATVSDKTGYALTVTPPTAAENADAVWDEARSGHTTAGTFGQGAASVQGNVTGSVATVTGGVTVSTNSDKTGYSLSATPPTAGEVADAVWDEARSRHTTSGTFGSGVIINTNSDKTGYALTVTPPTAAQVRAEMDSNSTQLAAIVADTNELQTEWADGGRLDLILDAAYAPSAEDVAAAVWAATVRTLTSAGAGGATAQEVWEYATRILTAPTNLAIPTAATIADSVWDEARTAHTSSGTFGQGVASVQGNVTGSAASVTGAVGSVTAAVTVGTITDKTGYSLATAPPTAVQVRQELDANSTRLAAIETDTGTDIPALIAALENLTADDVLDEVVEGTVTMRQALRGLMAVLMNKASGGNTTTLVYRDRLDTKPRLTLTVDENGNRTASTVDLT